MLYIQCHLNVTCFSIELINNNVFNYEIKKEVTFICKTVS